MGIVDKTVDTVGGAAIGGAKGAGIGFLAPLVTGAVIGGLVASGGVAAVAAGVALGGVVGGAVGAMFGAQLGGAIGVIAGAAKGLFKSKDDPTPKLEQQLAEVRENNANLTTQLLEQRRQMAGGFDNPDATVGHVAKAQAAAQAQAQSVNTPA